MKTATMARNMGITIEQFEELRERLEFAYTIEDAQDVGAWVCVWTAKDRRDFLAGNITDLLVYHSFNGYAFSDDDFSCTCHHAQTAGELARAVHDLGALRDALCESNGGCYPVCLDVAITTLSNLLNDNA